MKLDMLQNLEDADLRAVIGRAEELLKQHDTERKEKALANARTTLAAVEWQHLGTVPRIISTL